MLKRFEIENFRNFKNKLVLDFSRVGGYQFNQECIIGGYIGKMLIYGRNATGKTNLGRAILDIAASIAGTIGIQSGILLNADSSSRYAEYHYVFQFGEVEVSYIYKRVSEYELLDEELRVNGERVFYFNFETKSGDFTGLSLVNAETIVIERYLEIMEDTFLEPTEENGTLPFLRWLIANTPLSEGAVLLKLFSYIKRMTALSVSASSMFMPGKFYDNFYDRLAENNNLVDFEEFLNAMGVECKLKLEALPDGRKELYFVHERLIPFGKTASSGTIALMNLYIQLMRTDISFMLLDEYDAFYHYEMSETVIKYFKKKYPNCQVIMTTHNTNLMTNRLMRPDCLFILSKDGRLTALCDATSRELREGHNLEKLYISGEFEEYE